MNRSTLIIAAIMALPLAGSAQLQNLDFENWINPITPFAANRPTGWLVTYDALSTSGSYCYYPPDSGAQSGDLALKLSVWYNYTKDLAIQDAPINYRPTQLRGFYKYTNNVLFNNAQEQVADIAQASVYLTKWNGATAQKDTVGWGVLDLDSSAGYKAFNVAIQYNSNQMPDSIRLILDPSMLRRNPNIMFYSANAEASYLTVDNLSIPGNAPTTGTTTITTAELPLVYPNPAHNEIYIKGFSGEVQVFDMSGRTVRATPYFTGAGSVPLTGLPNGLYVLQLNNKGSIQRYKIAKQ